METLSYRGYGKTAAMATIEHRESGVRRVVIASDEHLKGLSIGDTIPAMDDDWELICTGREDCPCDVCHDAKAYYSEVE